MFMFRTKEDSGNVALLEPFAANVLEAIAGNIDLIINVAGVEPTV